MGLSHSPVAGVTDGADDRAVDGFSEPTFPGKYPSFTRGKPL
jgi:hypothetical protein